MIPVFEPVIGDEEITAVIDALSRGNCPGLSEKPCLISNRNLLNTADANMALP